MDKPIRASHRYLSLPLVLHLSLSLSRLSLLPSSLAGYIFIPSSVLSVSSPLLLQRRLSLSQQLKLNKRCDASIIDSDRLTLQLSLFSWLERLSQPDLFITLWVNKVKSHGRLLCSTRPLLSLKSVCSPHKRILFMFRSNVLTSQENT